MTGVADFVVLEPGEVEQRAGPPVFPRVKVGVMLGFGERRSIELEVSEAGIGEVADVLHRTGGENLVRELQHALGRGARDVSFDESLHFSKALRMLEREVVELRREAITHLEALDASVRQLFEYDLTAATVALRPESFGFEVDQDGKTSVPTSGPGLDNYRLLRASIAQLDALRRNVHKWNFTIPPNAPRARRQFEDNVLRPYTEGLAKAGKRWPALLVKAPPMLKKLSSEGAKDVQGWAQDSGNQTLLDDVIQETLLEAYIGQREEQPTYRVNILEAADQAMTWARGQIERYWEDSPSAVLGRHHPLWRYPFLIQAALEQQGYRPGDHGYAVGVAAVQAAVDHHEGSRQEAAEMDRMLGWASLGFGAIGWIPVVGQVALVAAAAVIAVQVLEGAQEYAEQTTAYEALGHQATRYDVPEPDAVGLVCNILSLTSEVALPLLGKLLGKTALRPTTRVLAATRVRTALDVGERASDLAALVIDANAVQVERELRRLQLLTVETGRQ